MMAADFWANDRSTGRSVVHGTVTASSQS